MKKVFLLLPVVLSLFLVGTALGHMWYKPFELNKISASAFNFLPETIEVMDEVDPANMYLHYARADSFVTQKVITPSLTKYVGNLKFNARGMEVTDEGKFKLFRVDVKASGPLECSEFSETRMVCTSEEGRMKVKRKGITESVKLKSLTFEADKDLETVKVSAEDESGTVLDVEGDMRRFRYVPRNFKLNK